MLSFARVFFGAWSLLFIVFAYLQFNDPDPEVWVSIYGLAAVLSALAAYGKYLLPVLLVAAVAALIGGIYLFPSSVSDWVIQEWRQADLTMKTPDMEEARESFGLLIIFVIMSIAAFIGWRQIKPSPIAKKNALHS
ncbi:transmembrane 220 family protein [Anditalea andensis]|uniref:Membrane protein n=1 Tax=Anditalea andensis TaxID=1048983 RepID=A0A074KW82_9BACT|nr:transmembrane 220 family protein [Anditalea andensis]KEO71878.1 membrane protein [Anditalea andensis]